MLEPILVPVGTIILVILLMRGIHTQLFTQRLKFFYSNAAAWLFLYFSAWAIVLGFLFPTHVWQLFSGVSVIGYILLVFLFVVLFPFIFHILRTKTEKQEWLANMYPDEPLLSPEEQFILGKTGDVIAQDFAVGILILLLAGAGVSYPVIVGIFVVLFALAHVYIFATSGFFWGLYYVTYALLAGFVFPFFVLFTSGGIAYVMVVHMLFYVVSAALFAKLPRPSKAVSKHILGRHTHHES